MMCGMAGSARKSRAARRVPRALRPALISTLKAITGELKHLDAAVTESGATAQGGTIESGGIATRSVGVHGWRKAHGCVRMFVR